MSDYDEEEDWESSEDTLLGLTSSHLSSIINILFWLIGAGLILWIGLALFSPKKNSGYESKVDNFKDYKKDKVDEESGVFESVAKSFRKALNLESNEQSQPEIKTYKAPISCVPFGCPPARLASSFCLDPDSGAAFLYGGMAEKMYLGDMHFYDTGKFNWKEVKVGVDGMGDPGRRCHVRMGFCGKFLCMFGGSTENGDCTDALYVMDVRESPLGWVKIEQGEDGEDLAPKPKPRFGHAMCSVGPYIVVFGGMGENETYLNDMWLLDTQNNFSWQYVKPGGNYWPKARDSHAITELPGQNKLLLFGGFDGVSDVVVPPGVLEVYDFETLEWSEVPTCGDGPSAGANVSVHAMGSSGKLVTIVDVNGGIFNQMHVCDMTQSVWQWSELELDWRGDWTMIPGQRSYLSSCYDSLEGMMYVFGGKSGGSSGMLHNTLVCINLQEVAGIEEEVKAVDEEEEGDEEVKDPARTPEQVRDAIKGSFLPGSARFKDKKKKTN
ncbi:hypothetical protein TrLO_g4023 [Triparma laevis f. longispina]|uniref:Kelch repeat-containing protein n=1 Tax=Triparma laevis f. longispina TaxID=1714387 RepID=A0A9W7AYD4_9STRA|nr:hypothetical protein TrLO_g4023 [Triparma laevis f. longispina]